MRGSSWAHAPPARRARFAGCALLLCAGGVAQDARPPVCDDTCAAGSQYANNGVCEERGLARAPCEASHSCLCAPLSDGSDCQPLRPCALPNRGVARPPPPAPLVRPAPTPVVSSRQAPTTRGARHKGQEAELYLAMSLSMTLPLLGVYWHVRRRARQKRAGKMPGPPIVLPPSAPATVGLLCMQVVRAKGLSTGRMFKASVRVTVASDRVAHVERAHSAVRHSKYSPTGFSVEWYEDLRIPIVCEDAFLLVELVEHVPAQSGEIAQELVLATLPRWDAIQEPSSDNGWSSLVAREGYEEQIEGGMLKLKLVWHAAQTAADGTVTVAAPEFSSMVFDTATVEELADALMQGTLREKAIKACLGEPPAAAIFDLLVHGQALHSQPELQLLVSGFARRAHTKDYDGRSLGMPDRRTQASVCAFCETAGSTGNTTAMHVTLLGYRRWSKSCRSCCG